MSLIRYQLFCVYKKTGMKVGIFELKNNKVCFKYEFMDKQFTKVMKGITITTVMTCNEVFNPEKPDTFFEPV